MYKISGQSINSKNVNCNNEHDDDDDDVIRIKIMKTEDN